MFLETNKNQVAELRDVLEKEYKFLVVEILLDKTGGPQKQLNKHLASFVHDHDDEDTLLVIYYAGHGWRKKNKDNEKEFYLIEYDYLARPWYSLLTSCRRVTETASWGHKHNKVAWDLSERILEGADGDVLGIFDCCHAGHLSQFRSPLRFEYLGACASDQVTNPPGPRSFTSALIWALKKLKSEGPFSTSALQRKIKDAPDYPKNQYPHLGPRLGSATDYIMIAPHEEDGPGNQVHNEQQSPAICDSFDLRIYVRDMNDQVIKAWAKAMNRHRSDKDLKVERYDFRGTNLSRCLLVWRGRARDSTEGRLGQPSTIASLSVQDPSSNQNDNSSHLQSSTQRDPLTPSSYQSESQRLSGNDEGNDGSRESRPTAKKRKRNAESGKSQDRRGKRSSNRLL
jgi:hypothetical protein